MAKELLGQIFSQIADGELGRALTSMENLLYTYPQLYSTEPVLQLREEYRLMSDYWRRGYADPQRQEVFQGLLRRLFALATDVAISHRLRSSSFLSDAYTRPRKSGREWAVGAIRSELESFVAETALLQLQPEHVARQQAEQIHQVHQQTMSQLFDYVWTSLSWNESMEQAFSDILLSPTVDSTDQQLLVSAVTLSAMNAFDAAKLRLLLRVYSSSAVEAVRQRALVGWVFCSGNGQLDLFPETKAMVDEQLADERCRTELAELQLQVFYCINAEADNHTIQQEIMPDLMKNNSYRVTRNGVEEVDDDPLLDILDPEASERNIERMEQSVRKMIDMQRAGSDIYFGGFSQMKRYPFFQTVSNWFVPFYSRHPAIAGLLGDGRGRKFLRTMVEQGPFCDSDKYSFVLAFDQVASRIPDSLFRLLDSGEAHLIGSELDAADKSQPAYIRRMYLQNFYRFFRLFPQRSLFFNPFQSADNYLFFARPHFSHPLLADRHVEVASFLFKRKKYEDCERVLSGFAAEPTLRYHVLSGNVALLLHPESGETAAKHFYQALELSQGDVQALSGLARARFREGDHAGALDCYIRLLELQPDKRSYLLNKAVCQTHLGQTADALKTLYQLNYERPDDDNVSRVLAWALVVDGKYEQAAKIYVRLLGQEPLVADDQLNYGYCLWLSGNVDGAVTMFRQYAAQPTLRDHAPGGGTAEQILRHEFFGDGHRLLSAVGITDTDIQLMLDHLE